MYVLLVRTKGRLNPLRTVFEKHVKRSCLEAVKRISKDESDMAEPKSYAVILLEVYKKHNELPQSAFCGKRSL